MNQLIVQRDTLIDAPIEHVWQLVATEDGLRQWWGNTIVLEAKEGGRCEEWRMEHNRLIHWHGTVTHFAPPAHLVITLAAQDINPSGPKLATIHIALEAEREQTRVRVTHRAFAQEPARATEFDRKDQRDNLPNPHRPHGVPMAQLERPAPGALAMPTTTLGNGRIDPTHWLVSQPQQDALTTTWHTRLASLATCASAPQR